MKVSELKRLIKDLPDNAEVYLAGASRLKAARCSAVRVQINKKLEPAQPQIVDSDKNPNALLIQSK